MAVYKVFLEKDSFLYSEAPNANAGRDEILEIGSYPIGGKGYSSRTVVKYDLAEIQGIIDANTTISDVTATLRLFLADAKEVPTGYTLKGYPIAEDWDEGTGRFNTTPINTTGVSWSRNAANSTWSTLPITGVGNHEDPSGVPGGGIWFSDASLHATEDFTVKSSHDVNLDISAMLSAQYSGTIPNHGVLVKLPDVNEFNTNRDFKLKYFSTQSHTVYPPVVELKWDDSIYTSTLDEITDPYAVVTVKGNRGEYVDEGKQRFRLHVRDRYPAREFRTTSGYIDNHKLPEGSTWAIRDENSEDMVIDFHPTYTKISADNTSSYFDIFMEGLQPERYYRILIKTEIDGSTVVIDNDQIFKVVRNG